MKSACQCHNETTNIWSHFLGAVGFIFLFVYFTVYFKPFDIPLPDVVKRARDYASSPSLPLSSILVSTVEHFTLNTSYGIDLFSSNQSVKDEYGIISRTLDKLKFFETELKTELAETTEREIDHYS